jgi:hypothetical protein
LYGKEKDIMADDKAIVVPPTAHSGETKKQFHDRVDRDYISKGYVLANLSQINQNHYCAGNGCRGTDPNEVIQ